MSYARTKNDFLIRVIYLLPIPLAKTWILPNLRDEFPDLVIGDRKIMSPADTTAEIIDKTRALTDNDIIAIVAERIPDALVSIAHSDDMMDVEFHERHANEVMSLVRKIDPTESGIGAKIRDTIRDNFDFRSYHI